MPAFVLLASACLFILSLPPPSAAQPFTVGVRLDFATGASPYSVAMGM